MEKKRPEQLDHLREQGWYSDLETDTLQQREILRGIVGGPTYLKDPAGMIHYCSGGTQRAIGLRLPILGDAIHG